MHATTARPGGLRGVTAFVASRFRGRPDSEHQMVINRLAISSLLMVYLAISGILHTMEVLQPVIANAVYGLISLGFFLHMLAVPGICHPRRIVGMCVDIGALTYCLYVGGSTTAVLYPIYLWIIFGNGFRFGLRYLFASMALALIGFATLLAASPYWSGTGHLGIGLLAGLLVLPAYTSTLIRSLNKARTEAEEASKAKSQFLASVSHELRTPLNAVIGMSDLLNDSRLDADQADMVTTVSGSARSLLALIEGILDFSRIESGRMPIESVDFDLHQTLTAVKNMLQAEARAKGLSLALHVTPRTPYRLTGDGRHLQDILVNLVANAVKFTESGRVMVSAECVSVSEAGSRIRFEVSDTGIGISAEATGRIFERFTQADETILNRYGGTGLGLAICRQLAEALGGAIGVDSVEGEGSTFWLELEFDVRAPEVQPRLDGLTIVLFSEDVPLASALATALEDTGAALSVAATMADAERLLDAEDAPRRLILVDEALADCDKAAATLMKAERTDLSAALVRFADAEDSLPEARCELYCAALPREFDRDAILAVAALARGQSSRGGNTIAEAVANSDGRSLSVLVAEDNGVNQKVVTKILERCGHRVSIVENGEDAVDQMLSQAFDIVLMDINMPVMNGLDAAKLYRFAALGRERLPIIALTADATPEARARCEEAGIDACVTKPIDAAELFRIIDELVAEGAGHAAPPLVKADDVVAEIATHPRFRAESRVIDARTIEQLKGLGGSDFVADLAGVFVTEGERILEELAESVAQGDYEAFRDRAHALRSGAANIGALPLYELCLSLRAVGSSEFATTGSEKLVEIEREFAKARDELRRDYGSPEEEAAPAGADAEIETGPSLTPPRRVAGGRQSGGSAQP